MDLKKWIKLQGLTVTEFAQEMGVERNTMSRIVNHSAKPSPKLAKKIEERTNGEITTHKLLFPEDFE